MKYDKEIIKERVHLKLPAAPLERDIRFAPTSSRECARFCGSIATSSVDLWQILAKTLYKNTLLRPYMTLHLNDLFTISICSYGPTLRDQVVPVRCIRLLY